MKCAVVQFIKGGMDTGERNHLCKFFLSCVNFTMRGLHVGDAGQGTRHRRRQCRLAKGQGTDP